MVHVQVLVGVSALRCSEAHRGEAEAGQAAAGTGDHLLLVEGVPAAGAEGRRAGRVAGRGVVAVVVGRGSVGCRAPAERSTDDHAVVVQTGERGQAWGPVGDGGPTAV